MQTNETLSILQGYRVGWVKANSKAIQAIGTHVITHNSRFLVIYNSFNRIKYFFHFMSSGQHSTSYHTIGTPFITRSSRSTWGSSPSMSLKLGLSAHLMIIKSNIRILDKYIARLMIIRLSEIKRCLYDDLFPTQSECQPR